MFCPARFRPFTGYAVNSFSIFEFARFEKLSPSCTQTELLVFSSEIKYSKVDGHINERLIGKIIQNHSFSRVIEIYLEKEENVFELVYKM